MYWEKASPLTVLYDLFGIITDLELIFRSSRVNGNILSRIVETSIYQSVFIQILVVSTDWTHWNELGRLTVCRLGISIQ